MRNKIAVSGRATTEPVEMSTPGSAGIAALRAGFPGQTATGVCLVTAPLLALVGTISGVGAYHAKGADFVDGMVAHPDAFNLGVQCAQAAMILLIVGVAGLTTIISATHAGWGRSAGLLTVIGLCGPISFESLYWGAWHVTDSPAHRAAAALMMDRSQVIPRTIVNVTGPALVLGFILLAITAAKACVLDRPRALCLGATCMIPFGFISGYLVISAVAFVFTAIALVPLGARLLRDH